MRCSEQVKRFLYRILAASVILAVTPIANAALIVIGNQQLALSKLSKDQLAALYLGKPTSLTVNIIPIDQSGNSQIFADFYRQILGWSPEQVSQYRSQALFSGEGQQPTSVSSDQAALKAVQSSPTAIAYINSGALKSTTQGVKVLYGRYDPPAAESEQTWDGRMYNSREEGGYMSALGSEDSATSDSTSSQTTQDASMIDSSETDDNSVWRQLDRGMQLQLNVSDPAVSQWVNWFAKHPDILHTMLSNAGPYLYYIFQQTELRHMPSEFALLPMIESGFNPHATSSRGAAGLWQLMPVTADEYKLPLNWWFDGRRDVVDSTQASLNYLVKLHNQFQSWLLAAAAYNAGPSVVRAALAEKNGRLSSQTDAYWQISLPEETRTYVPKLLAISEIIAHPSRYGVSLPVLPTVSFFRRVQVNQQVDFGLMSRLSKTPIPVLRALNPGMLQWASDPAHPQVVLIPTRAAASFVGALDTQKKTAAMQWKRHQISKEDTLDSLSEQYHIPKALLADINGLSGSVLGQRKYVLVPTVAVSTSDIQRHPIQASSASSGGVDDALSNAVESQTRPLPPEVTGEPIQSSDNLKLLVTKLYGNT